MRLTAAVALAALLISAGTAGATGLVAISAANPLDDANSHTVCASL